MHLFTRHRLWQLLGDAVIVAASWWLSFHLRFDHLNHPYTHLFWRTLPLVIGIKLVVFVGFGFYNRWWRYVSIRDMWQIVRGVIVASLLAYVTIYLVNPVHGWRLPRGVAAM